MLVAVACIWAVVALGLAAVVTISALYAAEYRSEIVLLVLGQTITVLLPAVLSLFVLRGAGWARVSYLLLSVVGVTLRLLGLIDSLAAGPLVISVLQAASIVLTLTAGVLLCSRVARTFFGNTRLAG